MTCIIALLKSTIVFPIMSVHSWPHITKLAKEPSYQTWTSNLYQKLCQIIITNSSKITIGYIDNMMTYNKGRLVY